MTGDDQKYFELCFKSGLVKSPFLEVGSAKVQGSMPNLCDLARSHGLEEIRGVDLQLGVGVDFVFDFSLETENFISKFPGGTYSTTAVFNVLEHTFDPIRMLTNVLSITRSGGTMIISTPVIWPIHNFPGDYLRLLPDWYVMFAHRNNLILKPETFCWLTQFGIIPVEDHLVEGIYQIPNFLSMGRKKSPSKYWITRTVQKLFNTYGRSHSFTHAALGAAFILPG